MELMRHESIETTLRLYVGTDAQRTADAAWAAFDRAQIPNSDRFGSAFGSAPLPGCPAPRDGASLTVDGAGIEPATHGFSVRCSTN